MQRYDFLPREQLKAIPELPDPFVGPDGVRVQSPVEWPAQREYLKAMLAHYLYGHMPAEPGAVSGQLLYSRPVYAGRALAERVRITAGPAGQIAFEADIIRPAAAGRVPVFTWNQFSDRRGCPAEQEIVVERGYAIAEFDKAQLAPDDGSAARCALALAYPECDWGCIAMWAWGHSRLADWLLTTDWADPHGLIATGHSRGGKAALCAAIFDERFAVCAPNNSGCGGAGCFRFVGSRLGENVGVCETAGKINDNFPYWWTDAFAAFGARALAYTRSDCPVQLTEADRKKAGAHLAENLLDGEELLPFDLHTAKALIAPRALITTEALADAWANTFGSQITWRAAQEVFAFTGMPGNNAIHFREGGHEFRAEDWHVIADFCDTVLRGAPANKSTVRFDPQEARDAFMRSIDPREAKLHYSWSCPQAGE